MQQRLISLGAPPEKVYCNPCGVDCSVFSSASPVTAGPVFVAVGRFVEKKAPQLDQPAMAARMGEAARDHVAAHFSMEPSLARLWAIIDRSIGGHQQVPASHRAAAESEPSEPNLEPGTQHLGTDLRNVELGASGRLLRVKR